MYELARKAMLSACLILSTAVSAAADPLARAEMPVDGELVVETVLERFPGGRIKIERQVALDKDLNYVNHGELTMYDDAGNSIAQGRFVAGLREGKWTRLHQPGDSRLFAHAPFKRFEAPFLSEANFENGLLQGTWTISDAQGRKMSEIQFVDGIRNGKLLFYTPEGKIARDIDFCDGVIDGLDRTYNDDGELVSEQKYVDGRRYVLQTETYISTAKKSEGYFLHPRTTVDRRDDWWSATLATFGKQAGEPIRHGAYSAWHVNGQPKTQGEYAYGKPVGEFVWWHANGQVAIRGTYKDGKHHREWQWWHENGMRAAKGDYHSGARIGRWLQWEDDGQLAKATDYGSAESPVAAGADEQGGTSSARRLDGPQNTTPR